MAPGADRTRLRRGVLAAAALLALQLAACGPGAAERPAERPVVAGYLAAWSTGEGGLAIPDIPAAVLTHLHYAFAGVSEDGRAVLWDPCVDVGDCPPDRAPPAPGGNFARLAALKHDNPHLKLLISIGGWTGSKYFSDAAATAESRRRFVASAVDLFITGQAGLFDGIDIDWEFPVEGGLAENLRRPEDGANLTRLMAEFRRQLDALPGGERFELAMAVSAYPPYMKHLQGARLAKIVDRFKVMAYDYHVGAGMAHFNTPLFPVTGDPTPGLNVDTSVKLFLASGFPAAKLQLGLAFYGRGYGGVEARNRGLFQPGDPALALGWGEDVIGYKELRARRPTEQGFEEHWHEEAQVPWLFNPELGVWITYDDPRSIERKAAYAAKRGLGGVSIWELSGDDGSLLAAAHRGLGRSARTN